MRRQKRTAGACVAHHHCQRRYRDWMHSASSRDARQLRRNGAAQRPAPCDRAASLTVRGRRSCAAAPVGPKQHSLGHSVSSRPKREVRRNSAESKAARNPKARAARREPPERRASGIITVTVSAGAGVEYDRRRWLTRARMQGVRDEQLRSSRTVTAGGGARSTRRTRAASGPLSAAGTWSLRARRQREPPESG